jgi:4'-phosphopantetheinyl transferase
MAAKLFTANISQQQMKEWCCQFYHHLPGNEQEKACCFLHEEDRLRFIAGRLMIRALAREICGMPAPEIQLTEYGKPFIRGADGFHFNISHSGDRVVLAVNDTPIGIDIERIVPIEWRELSKFFSQKEREMLRNDTDPLKCFYRIWTVREAFSKAVGKGLPLFEEEEADICFSCGTVAYQGRKLFFDCQEKDGYCLSVCGSTADISADIHDFINRAL